MDIDNVVLFDCSEGDAAKYVIGAFSIRDWEDSEGARRAHQSQAQTPPVTV